MRQLTIEKIADVRQRCLKGESIRTIAAATGVAHNTILKYRRGLFDAQLCGCGRHEGHSGFCKARILTKTAIDNFKCECGQPHFHRGWCWWRFARSPKRQAVMAKMQAGYRRPVFKRLVQQAKALPFDEIKAPTKAQLMGSRAPGSSHSISGGG